MLPHGYRQICFHVSEWDTCVWVCVCMCDVIPAKHGAIVTGVVTVSVGNLSTESILVYSSMIHLCPST